eukprot:gene10659-11821_t
MESYHPPNTKVDLKTAIRFFTEVQKHIELNKGLPWNLSNDAIKAAVAYHSAPEAQGFISELMLKVITIMTMQSPSRLGALERQIVEDGLYHALCISLVRMSDMPHLLAVISRVFDPKIPFYSGSKLGYTFTPGFPQVRIQLSRKFAELRGFLKVSELLKRSDVPWLGAEIFLHLLNTIQLPEISSLVDDKIRESLLNSTMERLRLLPDEILKKEATDVMSSLIQAVGSVFYTQLNEPNYSSSSNPGSLHAQRDEAFFHFWYQMIWKCITSSSLIVKLFGYDQLNELLVELKGLRPLAGSFIVENAGTDFVNGLYLVNTKISLESCECFQYVKQPEEGSGQPLLTLFRCTMRNTKAKWWFISQADLEKPGTDKDIDYYLNRSNLEDEREPPLCGWHHSNPGMKFLGEEPPPILRRGKPLLINQYSGLTEEMLVDTRFLQWIQSTPFSVVQGSTTDENNSGNNSLNIAATNTGSLIACLFHIPSMHREIISRAEKFFLFLIDYNALTIDHMALIWKAILGCHEMDILEEIFTLVVHILYLLPLELAKYLLKNALEVLKHDEVFPKMIIFAEKLALEHFKYCLVLHHPDLWEELILFSWTLYQHPLLEGCKNSSAVLDLLSFCLLQPMGRQMALDWMTKYLSALQGYAAKTGIPSGLLGCWSSEALQTAMEVFSKKRFDDKTNDREVDDEEEIARIVNSLGLMLNKMDMTAELLQWLHRASVGEIIIQEIIRFSLVHREKWNALSPSESKKNGYGKQLDLRFQLLHRYLSYHFHQQNTSYSLLYDDDDDVMLGEATRQQQDFFEEEKDDIVESVSWRAVRCLYQLLRTQPLEIEAFFVFLRSLHKSSAIMQTAATRFPSTDRGLTNAAAGGNKARDRYLLNYDIFERFLCDPSLNWTELKEDALDCFRVYFDDLEYLNNLYIRSLSQEFTKKQEDRLPPIKLGITTLWRIALHVEDQKALQAAIDLLLSAYEGFVDSQSRLFTPQEILNIIFAQLEVCQHVYQTLQANEDGKGLEVPGVSSNDYDIFINHQIETLEEANSLCSRSLTILTEAIHKFSSGGVIAHIASMKMSRFTLHCYYKRHYSSYYPSSHLTDNQSYGRNGNNSTSEGYVKVEVHPFHTVNNLKNIIISQAQLDRNVRIIFDQEVQPLDSTRLADLRLVDGQEITISYEYVSQHSAGGGHASNTYIPHSYSDDLYALPPIAPASSSYGGHTNRLSPAYGGGAHDSYEMSVTSPDTSFDTLGGNNVGGLESSSNQLAQLLADDYSKFDTLLTLCQLVKDRTLRRDLWEVLVLLPTQSTLSSMVESFLVDSSNHLSMDHLEGHLTDYVINSLDTSESEAASGSQPLMKWRELLDSKTIPLARLAYMLQVLDILLEPPLEASAVGAGRQRGLEDEDDGGMLRIQQAQEYRCNFILTGGLESLLSVLLNQLSDTQTAGSSEDEISYSLYAVLLHLLQDLLITREGDIERPVKEDVDSEDEEVGNSSQAAVVPLAPRGGGQRIPVRLSLSSPEQQTLLETFLYVAHLMATRPNGSDGIQNAMELIIYIMKEGSALGSNITNGNLYARELIHVVFRSNHQRVRAMAYTFSLQWGQVDSVMLTWIMEEIGNVPFESNNCQELFNVCQDLLSYYYDRSDQVKEGGEVSVIVQKIVDQLSVLSAEKIRSFSSSSAALSRLLGEEKTVLVCYLSLLAHLLGLDSSLPERQTTLQLDMVRFIFHACLFFLPGHRTQGDDKENVDILEGAGIGQAVCDTPTSRTAAFHLLSVYASLSSDYYLYLLHEMEKLVRLAGKHLNHHFNLQISHEIKPTAIALTGLKNQGCTCYLNACLQFLFNSSTFREAITQLAVPEIYRHTLWHRHPVDLLGRFLLLEYPSASAIDGGEIGGVGAVHVLGNVYRLGKCIGYDPELGYHRIQYYSIQPLGLDEVVALPLHQGRLGKETGRVKLVPQQYLNEYLHLSGQTESASNERLEDVANLLEGLQKDLVRDYRLNEKEEAAWYCIDQLQRIFINLKHSQRKYYDPKPFIDACKPALNLNYNIYHQNDAAEFYDQLLDRLEIATKNHNLAPLPSSSSLSQETKSYWDGVFQEDVFGGKYVTQKIPQDCPFYARDKASCGHSQSSNIEPFLKIELLLRGKETLEESLDELIRSELMDGENKIHCDVCEEKKAVQRFTSLLHLPPLLIIHLKRFDLDFNTFETVKLNSRLAFPMVINLYPYTKDGINKKQQEEEEEEGNNEQEENGLLREEDCEYELEGVLVHAGIAQGGHYYAFLRNSSDGKWYRFDDEDVTPFDPEHIPFHCFGGSSSSYGSTHGTTGVGGDEDRTANALMLLYSKRRSSSSSSHVSSPIVTTPAGRSVNSESNKIVTGEAAYLREVQEANFQHLLSCYLVDPAGHAFLTLLLSSTANSLISNNSLAIPSNKTKKRKKRKVVALQWLQQTSSSTALSTSSTMLEPVVELVMSYLCDVCLHFRERPAVKSMIDALQQTFVSHPSMAYWLVTTLLVSPTAAATVAAAGGNVGGVIGAGWWMDYLLYCPDPLARGIFLNIFLHALRALIESNPELSSPNTSVLQPFNTMKITEIRREVTSNNSMPALMALLIRQVIDLVFKAVGHSRNADEIFVLIRELAQWQHLFLPALQGLGTISILSYYLIPEVVSSSIVHIFEKHLPTTTTSGSATSSLGTGSGSGGYGVNKKAADYHHLHQSVLEAIAALLGVPQLRKVPLLQDKSYWDNELTVEAKAAFTTIFQECCRLSGSGGSGMMMDSYDLTHYLDRVSGVTSSTTTSATNTMSGKSQAAQVKNLLERYGVAGSGGSVGTGGTTTRYLHLDGFLQHLADTASYNPKAVWKELYAFGYRNDLSRNIPTSTVSTTAAGDVEMDDLEITTTVPAGTTTTTTTTTTHVPSTPSQHVPLHLNENCRLCLRQLSFYEIGLPASESACKAIARRISLNDLETSDALLTQILSKLYLLSRENSWIPQSALLLQDLLKHLLAIEEDGLQEKRLRTVLLCANYGLAVVITQERVKPSMCRANDYNKHYLCERYVAALQDLITSPLPSSSNSTATSTSTSLVTLLQGLAKEDSRIMTVKGMLKLRPGAILTEEEEERVRETIIRVEGAGCSLVNGDYEFEAIKNAAGYYQRYVSMATTATTTATSSTSSAASSLDRLTLYKCSLQNGGYQWFISITPPGCEPGTKNDIDFYFAPAKHSDRLPPMTGWAKISSNAAASSSTSNALIPRDPSPRLLYILQSDVEVVSGTRGVGRGSVGMDDDDDLPPPPPGSSTTSAYSASSLIHRLSHTALGNDDDDDDDVDNYGYGNGTRGRGGYEEEEDEDSIDDNSVRCVGGRIQDFDEDALDEEYRIQTEPLPPPPPLPTATFADAIAAAAAGTTYYNSGGGRGSGGSGSAPPGLSVGDSHSSLRDRSATLGSDEDDE